MIKELKILEKAFEEKFTKNRVALIYIFEAISGVIFLSFFYLNIKILTGCIFLLIGLSYIAIRIQDNKNLRLIKRNFCGSIILNQENIIDINVDEYHLKLIQGDVQSIEFEYWGYYGEGNLFKSIFYPKYQNYYFGTSNKLVVNYDNKSHILNLFLRNKEHRKVIYDIINIALENQIHVKEWNRGKQSYGGKFLKYADIQKYKKKYTKP